MLWKESFPPTQKPTILDLRNCLSASAMQLLERFNRELFQKYRIKATPPRHTQKSGWVFPYKLHGVTLFSMTVQDENAFAMDALAIRDDSTLMEALSEIDRRCQAGFLRRAEKAADSRKERARNRRMPPQISGEEEAEALPPGADPEKLNRFSWEPALSPIQLRKLYRSSASGMLDHDLLEDVGLQLYMRCRQGTEEFALLQSEKLKCHHCGAVLPKEDGLMVCRCGYQYTFREYCNSFTGHRMPGGNAAHIFSEFAGKWPSARTDHEKMLLIDWMIHQCHISMASGLPLRSVLKNLIDAPQRTAEQLVLELAYGDVSGGRT